MVSRLLAVEEYFDEEDCGCDAPDPPGRLGEAPAVNCDVFRRSVRGRFLFFRFEERNPVTLKKLDPFLFFSGEVWALLGTDV